MTLHSGLTEQQQETFNAELRRITDALPIARNPDACLVAQIWAVYQDQAARGMTRHRFAALCLQAFRETAQ